MTDKELKEKIIQIYIEACSPSYIRGQKDKNGEEIIPQIDILADALIDAGIGDMSAYKDKKLSSVNTSLEKLSKDDIIWAYQMLETSAKAEIERLTIENARLRARLEKAVELPCKVGDTVYGIGITDCDDAHTTDEKQKRKIFNDCMKMFGHCEKCKHGHLAITEFICTHIQIGENGISNSYVLIVGEKTENYIAENVFTTREAAEARLKELQGGQGNAGNRS